MSHAESTRPAAGVGRDRRLRCTLRTAVTLTVVLALGPACGGSSSVGAGGDPVDTPRIELQSGDVTGSSTVVLKGLPADDLSAVRDAALTSDEWSALFRVSVAGAADLRSRPSVLGIYSVSDGTIHFSPLYDFDPGRGYRVVFDPSRLPERLSRLNGAAWSRTLDVTVREPAPDLQPTTAVVQVYPTAEVLPANLLRLYVYFSAPMGMKGGADYIRLLDEDGHAVDDPFLPLDLALWNADRTRYTLLFDPGRVKRGILPNEQMGRSISTGRTYTLVISREWRDASGLPLRAPFSRQFSVGPPENRGIDPSEWQVVTPLAGTHEPLVVSFRRPLDYALLQRTLVVTTAEGARVDGEIETKVAETRWIFKPREPWRTSTYHLTALPVLEDPAGNRVGRPFEVALSERTARPGEAPEARVSFFPR